jgi:predicted alpha-1,2-mannosidase
MVEVEMQSCLDKTDLSENRIKPSATADGSDSAKFMQNALKTIFIIVTILFVAKTHFAQDFTKFVNPFIGTKDTGHTFPGAAAPFGLVQPSPDTGDSGWAYTSGYQFADKQILGFSNTHLSGTGVPDLGDILLQPFNGEAMRENYKSSFDKSSEKAMAGLYTVFLKDSGVKVDLTASERVAFHRYTFDSDKPQHILADFQHGMAWADVRERVLASDIKIEDSQTISGYCEVENWVKRKYFFVVKFDKPFAKSQQLSPQEFEKAPRYVLSFDGKRGNQIQVKVAVSTVSIEGAKKNLQTEIPHWNFAKTEAQTKAKWNELLSRIQIEADDAQKEIFYTSLYHTMIQPNNIADVDGKYRGADDKIHQAKDGVYYSTFSLWDTFRATHQLYTIVVPERVDGFVNSMLAHSEATGFLPMWTLWGKETNTMIGNPAIPVITDAYGKGFRGFDGEKAFAAMKRTSTVSQKFFDYDVYLKYGYLPFDKVEGHEAQTVSRTLEAGVSDGAVAEMAGMLGKKADEKEFLRRSKFYENLFDPETKLMRGKDSKGNWRTPFDPLAPTSPLRNPGDYTEANAWQYSFASQHDILGLIKLQGGKANFAEKLDKFFSPRTEADGDDEHLKFLGQEGLIGQYSHGNEPSHHIAYLYKFTDEGYKTDELIREITTRFYSTKPDGITGNDDCGQMSAWYVMSVIGLYPVHPSNGEYVFGSPQVSSVNIKLATGKSLRIEAKSPSEANKFVKEIYWNGKPFEKMTISHSELMKGGKLTFLMSDKK